MGAKWPLLSTRPNAPINKQTNLFLWKEVMVIRVSFFQWKLTVWPGLGMSCRRFCLWTWCSDGSDECSNCNLDRVPHPVLIYGRTLGEYRAITLHQLGSETNNVETCYLPLTRYLLEKVVCALYIWQVEFSIVLNPFTLFSWPSVWKLVGRISPSHGACFWEILSEFWVGGKEPGCC